MCQSSTQFLALPQVHCLFLRRLLRLIVPGRYDSLSTGNFERNLMLQTLLEYFSRYGYWVIFFGVMLENAGLPIPGETILLAAGFVASLGHFNIAAVMVIAAIGAMLGDNAGYAIGRKLGRTALER